MSAALQSLVNGQLVPASEAVLPITDFGVTMGVTLIERMRTFSGRPIFIDRHLDRLLAALPTIGIASAPTNPDPLQAQQLTRPVLYESVSKLLQTNLPLVKEQHGPTSELSIGILVTPGSPSQTGRPEPTVIVTATPLAEEKWSAAKERGLSLTIVDTREIPSSVIPKHVKHRSRLHYFIADREAEAKETGSRALLLDTEGYIAESTIGSIVMLVGNRLIAPRASNVLPSVTWGILKQSWLAESEAVDIDFAEANILPAQLMAADEVLWFSTSVGVLPIATIDGIPIGNAEVACTQRPGYQKFLRLWHVQLSKAIV